MISISFACIVRVHCIIILSILLIIHQFSPESLCCCKRVQDTGRGFGCGPHHYNTHKHSFTLYTHVVHKHAHTMYMYHNFAVKNFPLVGYICTMSIKVSSIEIFAG